MVPSDLRWLRNNPNDIFLRNGIWPAFFLIGSTMFFFLVLLVIRWWPHVATSLDGENVGGILPIFDELFRLVNYDEIYPDSLPYALISHWLCNVERFFLWRWLKLSVPSPHQDFLRSSRRKSNQVLVGLMKHVMYNCITSKCCSTNTGDLLITKYLYV